jgi:hypothetical protein
MLDAHDQLSIDIFTLMKKGVGELNPLEVALIVPVSGLRAILVQQPDLEVAQTNAQNLVSNLVAEIAEDRRAEESADLSQCQWVRPVIL